MQLVILANSGEASAGYTSKQSKLLTQTTIEQYSDSSKEKIQKWREIDPEPTLEFMGKTYSSTIVERVVPTCKLG